MPRRYVNELKDGEAVEEVYLLAEKQLRANRNAQLYLLAGLRDKTGLISGLMWNVTEELVGHVHAGNFVRVKGKVQLHQGSLQIIVTHIQPVPAEGLDPVEFHPQAGADVEKLLLQMTEILSTVANPHLRALIDCFLADEELIESLARSPAGVKTHHAYHGGLLEHVVNILETARRIRDLYPKVDFDLLLTGIFLHDLGKIREMSNQTTFTYTDEGQLLGHLIIAVEMLDEKIAEVRRTTDQPFPAELALRLKHMIVSHHGTYEFGSPKLPMTPEAIALHHLDNLDAKVHEFARSIEDDPNSDSSWTPYSPRLERKLFKGEKNGGEKSEKSAET